MWLPFVCFLFVFFFVFLVDFFFGLFCIPSWRQCPLLATFLSVVFCLLSRLYSEIVPGLIWFGSVYRVTTAGFVADHLM